MLNLQHNSGFVRDNLENNTAEIVNRVTVVLKIKLCRPIPGHCHVIISSDGNDMCLPILNIIQGLHLIHQSISEVHSTILLNPYWQLFNSAMTLLYNTINQLWCR